MVSDQGSIILQNSSVSSFAGTGVQVQQGTAIILQNQIVGNTRGIILQNATQEVRIEGNQIDRNGELGIGVFNSKAIILQNSIDETGKGRSDLGDGILAVGTPTGQNATSAAELTIKDNTVERSRRTGILIDGQVNGIILQNNTISQSGIDAEVGAGIWLQKGAGGLTPSAIENNKISHNKYGGIFISGDTRDIILQGNTIVSTVKGWMANTTQTEASLGFGVGLARGAFAKIVDNEITGNARFGVILDTAADNTVLSKNRIYDNAEAGIILQNSQCLIPDDNDFMGNAETVVSVQGNQYPIMQDLEHSN